MDGDEDTPVTFTCPRRCEGPAYATKDEDHWRDDGRCSYCGSISPDVFLQAVARGDEVGPTDKNYKVYVALPRPDVGDRRHSEAKFYFQHLSEEQRREFVGVVNQKKINVGYPGHFYVLPFFMVRG